MKQPLEFEEWYDILRDLAGGHGESVADRSAWREPYDQGQSVEDAFFDEYPEHRDGSE